MLLVIAFGFARMERAAAQADRAQQVFNMVNALRAEYGLAPYPWNSALAAAAQGHSEWGASVGYFSHEGPDGSRPTDRAVRAGYGAAGTVRATENIYWGSSATPESAVTWWRNSSIHFAQMTSTTYEELGVGVAYGPSGGYYTLVFGIKLGNAAPVNPSSGAGSGSGSTSGGQGVVLPPEPEIPVIATQAAREDGSIVHVVEEGQAIWSIAGAYKVDVLGLLAINGLTDESFIHAGDEITIREASTPTPPPTPTRLPTLTPIAAADRTVATEASAVGETAEAVVQSQADMTVKVLTASLVVGIGMVVIGLIGLRRG